MSMKYLSQLKKEGIAGKTCLLRINLDIKNPAKESLRIDAIIPTIKFLEENGTKIIILSHRGRPNGIDLKLSLEPFIEILSKKIGHKLEWLENLRFNPQEQENDAEFGRELASRGDFFVNDDFATSHRTCASLVAITKFLPSYAGLLLEKEIKNLSKVMTSPKKPLVVIIGGIKINDKVGMIENFKDKADHFLMGSAYSKLPTSNFKLTNKIMLPSDHITENNEDFDIGPETIKKYSEIIKTAKTIIWSGPLGLFENAKFLNGSKKIAEAVADSNAFTVVGGGDTSQLLKTLGIENRFSFISTGGGAMLEFLSGKKLPALEALENNNL